MKRILTLKNWESGIGICSLLCVGLLLFPHAPVRAQTVTTTVTVAGSPHAVAANRRTNKIYVADYSSSNVTIIDGATNSTTTVPTIAHGRPVAVAVNEVTNKIYVASVGSLIYGGETSGITVIDGATNATATVTDGGWPRALAVNSVTNKIYVANFVHSNVTVIDGATNSTTTITDPNASSLAIYAIAVNEVTNKIYALNNNIDRAGNNPGSITVIDGLTNSTTTVTDPNAITPFDVAVNPVTNKIYVANEGGYPGPNHGNVTVLDGATNATTTVTDPNALAPQAVAVDPVTNKIYVANINDSTLSKNGGVTVIDGATNSFVTVKDPNAIAPTAVAADPATNEIYVANGGDYDPYTNPNGNRGSITVIYGATNSFATIIDPNANSPSAVAVDSATSMVYVANSSNVTVIKEDHSTRAATSTTLDSSKNPSIFDTAVTFIATVTSPTSGTITGDVTFKERATVLGTASLNDGMATFTTAGLGPGTNLITAIYGGDPNFAGSTSATLSETIDKAGTSTVLVSSADPSAFKEVVKFTSTVTPMTSGTSTGTVTFKNGATALGSVAITAGQATFTTSTLTLGAHAMTATYSGSTDYNTSTSSVLTQTVNKTKTSITLVSLLNPSVFGQAVTFTATVAAVAPGSGTPTGTVTFKDGVTVLGSGTLSSGRATFSTSALMEGTHSITATYSGGTEYNISSSTVLTLTVNKASSSTTVVSSHNPSVFGQSVTFTATVAAVTPGSGTPTGTVTFKNGATVLGTGTLSSGKATFSTSVLAVGPHSITAVYGGSTNYNTSTSAVLTETVNKAASSTKLTSSLNPSTLGKSVTFTITLSRSPGSGTPTGTVTLKNGATTVGTATLVPRHCGAIISLAQTEGSNCLSWPVSTSCKTLL